MIRAVSVLPGRSRGLRVAAAAIAAVVAVPLFVVFAAWTRPVAGDVWQHMSTTVLPRVAFNTIVVLLGVTSCTAVVGTLLAWATTMLEFPGRRVLSFALLAPMAMPAYVLGFVYCGLLDFAGPLQSALRAVAPELASSVPEIRSRGGLVLVLSLALYPYVYMIARGAFLGQGVRALEAGRSLGLKPREAFVRLALPLARPWIAGALALVGMEVLADFGTASVFVVDTFTTGVYKAWLGFFSPEAAGRLASFLVLGAFAALWAEARGSRRRRYHAVGTGAARPARLQLSLVQKLVVAGGAWGVLALSFLIPAMQLLAWAWRIADAEQLARVGRLASHSLVLGMIVALTTATAALILVLAQRFSLTSFRVGLSSRIEVVAARVAVLGYALPGSVLAVGVFLPLVWLDERLATIASRILGFDSGLLLTGTLFAMVLGLTIRFIAVAEAPVAAGIASIPRRLDEAAAIHGPVTARSFIVLHGPQVARGLLTGAILVLVDVLKEMPLTLMTRPFGWDTLSVRIFELTSEGEWEKASLPAVLLLATGLVPVAVLARALRRTGEGSV